MQTRHIQPQPAQPCCCLQAPTSYRFSFFELLSAGRTFRANAGMHPGIRVNLQGSRRALTPAPLTLEVPRPQRPTTTSFPPDWLRSHGCWRFSYNIHPKGENVLYMGTLHELRGRTNCGFCQKLYGYLKDEDGLFRGYSENQVLCSVREGIVEEYFLTMSVSPDWPQTL